MYALTVNFCTFLVALPLVFPTLLTTGSVSEVLLVVNLFAGSVTFDLGVVCLDAPCGSGEEL